MPLFSETWPNVVLEIKTAPSETLREEIRKGRLDLAVISQPARLGQRRSEVLQVTTPVWVGTPRFMTPTDQPLPLALFAAPCSYRRAMTQALDEKGIAWRAILDTPSGNAVKACVEAGIGVSVVDRSRITSKMKILEHLPRIPDHEIVILQATREREAPEAMAVLAEAIRQRFRI
ncbi:HTH-type transcriptional regulator GltR [compost metagenome]